MEATLNSTIAPPTGVPVTPVLRAVLLCDIVDSTEMTGQLGDQRWSALMQRHDRMLRDALRLCHGQLIDRADGVLALFERPIQALDFALRYQRGLRELGREEGIELRARIGIHVGDVMMWANAPADVRAGAKPFEVEGLAKPVAARLMGLALPGQILMSGMAQNLAQRAVGELGEDTAARLRWLMHGRYRFKGVPAPMLVHEVGEVGVAPLRPPESGAKAWRELPLWRRPPMLAMEMLVVGALAVAGLWTTLRAPPAIAFAERDWVVVADLQNRTNEPLFDDALDVALRVGLEQSRHVNVVSELQVARALDRMQRGGQPLDRQVASEVALREGARAVILPTIAEVGGRVRVSLEVIDPGSGVTVYSQSADARGEQELLAAVDDVVGRTREQLGESLAAIEADSLPLEQVTSGNLEALKAFSLSNKALGQGDARQAMTLMEHAIELDPEFAAALVKMGGYYFQSDDLAKAREYMQRAAQSSQRLIRRDKVYLDAQLAIFEGPSPALDRFRLLADLFPDFMTGQQNTAVLYWQYFNDFTEAERWFREVAASRHPLRSLAMTGEAIALTGQGRIDEAERLYGDIAALGGQRTFGSDADPLLIRGEHARALETLSVGAERDIPAQRIWKGLRRAAVHADAGRMEQALAELDTLLPPEGARRGDAARILIARLSLLARHDPAAFAAALPQALAAQAERVARMEETLDASAPTHHLLLGLLAARHGRPELARGVLETARPVSENSGYPEREALLQALEAELAGAEQAGALAARLDNNRFYQAQVTRWRLLEAAGDEAAAATAAEQLCAGKGHALSEWSFGFSSLVPNLLAASEACMRTAGSR